MFPLTHTHCSIRSGSIKKVQFLFIFIYLTKLRVTIAHGKPRLPTAGLRLTHILSHEGEPSSNQ